LHILKQTENFVVIFKDARELSVPSRDRNDPRPVAGLLLTQHLGQQVYPIHRLDFGVSGVLLFALNSKAQALASKAFENRCVQKTYQGFSSSIGMGSLNNEQVWTSKIVRGKRRSFEADHGLEALTRAKALSNVKMGSFELVEWQLVPKTGRPHQLRFEMAKHQAPLVGDTLYGSHVQLKDAEIALRAVALEFSDADLVNELGPKLEAPRIVQLDFVTT
jgi:tRNA pseudouridine32 synthase / 23S rRNA pseudouridine746 synthase